MSCCTGVTKDTQSVVNHYGSEHIFTSRSKTGTIEIKSPGSEQLIVYSDSQLATMPWVYDLSTATAVADGSVYARNYSLVSTGSATASSISAMNFSEDSLYLGFQYRGLTYDFAEFWRRSSDSWLQSHMIKYVFTKTFLFFPPALDFNAEFVVSGNEYVFFGTGEDEGLINNLVSFMKNPGLETWVFNSIVGNEYNKNQIYAYGSTVILGYSEAGITEAAQEYTTNTAGSLSLVGSIVALSVLGFYNDTILFDTAIYKKTGASWASQATVPSGSYGAIISDTVVIGTGSTVHWITRSGATWTTQGSLSLTHTKLKLIDTNNFCVLSSGSLYVYNMIGGVITRVATVTPSVSTLLATGGPSRADKSTYIAVAGNSGPGYAFEVYKFTGLGSLVTDTRITVYNYECYGTMSNTDMSLGSMAFSPDSEYFAIGDGYATPAGSRDYNATRVYQNSGSEFSPVSDLVYRYSKTGPAFIDYIVGTDFYVSGNDYVLVSGSYSLTASDTMKSYKLGSGTPSLVQTGTDFKVFIDGSKMIGCQTGTDEYTIASSGAFTYVRNVSGFMPAENVLDYHNDTILCTDRIYFNSGGSWSEQYSEAGSSPSYVYQRGSLISNTVVWAKNSTFSYFTRTAGTWTQISTKNIVYTIIDVRLLTTALVAILDSSGTVFVYDLPEMNLVSTNRTCFAYPKLLTSGGTSRSDRKDYIAIGYSQTSATLVSKVQILKLASTSSQTSIESYSVLNFTNGSLTFVAGTNIYGTRTGDGSVLVTGTTASTSATNGSLVVTGGLAVQGSLNTSTMNIGSLTAGSAAGLDYGSLISLGTHGSTSMTTGSLDTSGVLRASVITIGTLNVSGSTNTVDITCTDLYCTSVNSKSSTYAMSDYVMLAGSGTQNITNAGTSTKLGSLYWTGQTVGSYAGSYMNITDGHISISRSGIYTMALTLPVPYSTGGPVSYARAALAVTDSNGLNKTYVALDSEPMVPAVDPMILNLSASAYVNSGSRVQAELLQVSGSELTLTSSTRSYMTVIRGSVV